MEEARRYRFRPSQRLRRGGEFDRVFQAGKRYDAKDFIAQYCPNSFRHDRLGLSVSRRRIGGAVARNKAKRIIRELFRRNPSRLEPGIDLVIAPRSSLLAAKFSDLESSWRRVLERIKSKLRGCKDDNKGIDRPDKPL